MLGESWDVFTKRVLVEKHINGIMYENLEGRAAPCSPTADAHASEVFREGHKAVKLSS